MSTFLKTCCLLTFLAIDSHAQADSYIPTLMYHLMIIGFDSINYNMRNGRRLSTYTAFLEPLQNNPRLTIYKFSEVTRVLLRGDDNEAFGVEYIRHGVKKSAFAKREIIVSAGAIQSPKILMNSGLGPKAHLESLGVCPSLEVFPDLVNVCDLLNQCSHHTLSCTHQIPVKADLPVGKNLQDHISVYLGPFLLDKPISMLLDRDVNTQTMEEFMKFGTGPVSSTGVEATGLISTKYAIEDGKGDWPDIQYILLGTGIYQRMPQDFAHAFHVDENKLMKYFAHAKGKDSFQIIVSLARPRQTGEMLLKSSDPLDRMLIDPKYLHDERDVKVLVEGLKRAVDLVENSTTFKAVGARFTDEKFPGCEHIPIRTDEYWECFARQYSITLHHIVGSCSMGKADSAESVTDSQLRVRGTKSLRVVDLSVIPAVPTTNSFPTALLVGSKGASMILDTWKELQNDL